MTFRPDPALAAQVFPAAHRNPTPRDRYDLVVIGGGTAGLVCAAGAAALGAQVALVERRALGGDCLNVGCVPSKALIRAAHAAHAVRTAGAFGVHATLDHVDFAAVMARVRDIRAAISPHDSVDRFRSLGVHVFLGEARFSGRRAVQVGADTLRFVRAVVATGGRPAMPAVPGLAEAGPLTNESVFEIADRPTRLLVIGGGPVGCELAQAFQRLGTRVTLVEAGPAILPREAAADAAIVRVALEADGVDVRVDARVTAVSPSGDVEGGHHVRVESRQGGESVRVDRILVATGRMPNVEHLGLQEAGVTWTADGIVVDDHLRTANRAVFAAGDVCLPQHFTHAADASARVVVRNALFAGRARVPAASIPRCTYTDPEIAQVGETTGEGLVTFDVPWAEVDRARIDGESPGGVRIHARRGRVVGGTIVGRGAGDLVGEVAVLVAGRMPLSALAAVVHPYPTRAEAIRKAGDLYNRTRLTPFTRGVLRTWIAWRR